MSNPNFKLSVSKTKTFLACKKQYHFSYILKFPKKERDYHILGSMTHKVLENFHNLYISGSDLPFNKGMSKSFKEAYAEFESKCTPEMKKESFNIIDSYLKIIYTQKDHPLSTNVIGCEKSFSIPIKENVILNGFIDRIQVDADGVLHVCDYKTTKNKKYLVNDFFQLLTYCYALLLEDPALDKIRASYILLRHNFEYVTEEFTKDKILEIKKKYIDYADSMISEKDFKPNPTILCGWCDFLQDCKEGLNQTSKKQQINGEIDW
jgi:putative RecB family exonuclease